MKFSSLGILALLSLPTALQAQTAAAGSGGVRQKEATVLMPENERQRQFQESWGFSEAIIVGDMIYLSGIVADKHPQDADITVSYDRVFRQIERILKRAGASWDDVVDITSFHTDVEAQIKPLVEVHKRYVKAPYPAWTAIGVSRILGNGITEIKIVAKKPAPRRGSSRR